MSTAAEAHGRWPAILRALGVDPKFLRNIHGPCPVCGGKDRFRFDDEYNGKFICNGCGSGDGFTLLQKLYGWDFKRAAKEIDQVIGRCPATTEAKPERTEAEKKAYLKQLYLESKPLSLDDPVMRYLARHGCSPVWPVEDLRFHPRLKHSIDGREHPAMLAVLRDPQGKACGLHRTYLTQDGQKASVDPVRMILGEAGFVALGPLSDCIGVAEGIETALAASRRFNLPVWSAISAGCIKKFIPPPDVKSVVIFGDNDRNFTGQAAAYALAWRLMREGLAVEVAIPERVGSDWADITEGAA